jgi:protein ImuB
MTRFVCAYLPDFAVERFRQRERVAPPEGTPFALVRSTSGGWHLCAVDAEARAKGLAPGQLLADARARLPALETREHRPERDSAALVKLAYWCTRFSPYVAPWPEREDHEGGLTFDIEGCAHLYGGESGMLDAMAAAFEKLGLSVRLGLADTIGAAHALAKYGRGTRTIAAPGEQRAAIAGLPVSALRIADTMAASLRHLGLKTVGDLVPLPRAPLTARFGKILLLRIDQALGHARESFSPLLPHAPARAQAILAEPITSEAHVLELVEKLAKDLSPLLEREGKGARALRLTLFRVDGEVVEAQIRLATASREPTHIVKLFSLKLDALADDYDAGFGFEAARLDVTEADRVKPAQTGLADDSEAAREAKLSLLIDRLGSRLGVENVLRASPRDTHIPERAMVLKPAAQYETQAWEEAPLRPLLMLPCAEPADVTAMLPEGPPLQFVWRGVRYATHHAEGPERIRPEWWRDTGTRARDYYTVEDEEGRRFWMYRDGPYDSETPPRWFVHGVYA